MATSSETVAPIRRGETKPAAPRMGSNTSLEIFLDENYVKFDRPESAQLKAAVERIVESVQAELDGIHLDDTLSDAGKRQRKESVYADAIAKLDDVRRRAIILVQTPARSLERASREAAVKAAQQFATSFGDDGGARRADVRRTIRELAGSENASDIKIVVVRILNTLHRSPENDGRAAEVVLALQSSPICAMLTERDEMDILDMAYSRIDVASEKWAAAKGWRKQFDNVNDLCGAAEGWLVDKCGCAKEVACFGIGRQPWPRRGPLLKE